MEYVHCPSCSTGQAPGEYCVACAWPIATAEVLVED